MLSFITKNRIMRHYFCVLETKHGFKFFELREMLRLTNPFKANMDILSIDLSKIDLTSKVSFLYEFDCGYGIN